MANTFLQLPAPAADGAGAAVDVSGMGGPKTIVVAGSWTLPPNTTIEFNNDPLQAGSWTALDTVQAGGFIVAEVASRWLRARVSNFKGGQAPEVWVGSTDAGASFAALGAPAGNGAAAAVDVSTLPLFKTVQIGGTFRGEVIVEISEDGGVTWGQPFPGFQAPGFASEILAADFMRVRRVGVPANTPGLPIVNVGACDVGGGGGGGSGNPQLFEYVAVGGEANPFTIAAAQGFVARATNTYQVQVTLKRPAANAIKVLSTVDATFTTTQFQVELSAALQAGDKLQFTVQDPT